MFCVDCRTTNTQPPRLKEGRSPRCHEHQRQRTRHVNKQRQARQRARTNPATRQTTTNPTYQPQPLHNSDADAVLLDAADLEQIDAVIADLRNALDNGNNAYRREDDNATRHALRDLLDRAYETVTILEEIRDTTNT